MPSGSPWHVPVLRLVLAHAVDLACGRDIASAKRERGDALRRRQIAFEQDRRDAEDVGVVVEAGARVVRRQERRGVDLQREEVANRVGVLRAIQPVHERTPRLRRETGGLVQRPGQ